MTPEPLTVVLIGARGRLGTHVDQLLAITPEFHVVARLDRGNVTADHIRETGAVLGVELTEAGNGCRHAVALLQAGVRPVVGTSGVTGPEIAKLDELARSCELGGLVVPNFSLGMWLLQKAATEFARHLPQAEIIETHHAGKLDAPSGTSLHTRELMASTRPAGASGEIPIHSVRLPGARANQEVVFGGPGELLKLTHETFSMDAYNAGILVALRHAATAVGVGCGIEIAFEAVGIPTGTLHPTAR